MRRAAKVFVAVLALAAAAAALRGGGEETPKTPKGQWMWCVAKALPESALHGAVVVDCKTKRPYCDGEFRWFVPEYIDDDTEISHVVNRIVYSNAMRILVLNPYDEDSWWGRE